MSRFSDAPATPSWHEARNAVAISSPDVRFADEIVDVMDIAVDNEGPQEVFGEWANGVRVTIAPVMWRTEHWLGSVHEGKQRDDFLFKNRELAVAWATARSLEEAEAYEDDLIEGSDGDDNRALDNFPPGLRR